MYGAAGIAPVLIERPENPTDRGALDFLDDDNEKAFNPGCKDGVTRITNLKDLLKLVT